MSALSPALDAALAAPQALVFAAIQMDLPGRTARMLAGSGTIKFPVDGALATFTGEDDVIGVFAAIDTLTDGGGDEAPALSITFIPASDAAIGQIASAAMQGSPVRLWLGAVDRSTGLVIGAPLMIFSGLLDVATVKISDKGREVDYEVTSIFEDFFDIDDGVRLNDTFHQYLWPGELGCQFVTYVAQQIYWGATSPDGVVR